jgi:hypothetical protein
MGSLERYEQFIDDLIVYADTNFSGDIKKALDYVFEHPSVASKENHQFARYAYNEKVWEYRVNLTSG